MLLLQLKMFSSDGNVESTQAVDMKKNIVISNKETCKDVKEGECDSKDKLKTTITGNGKKYEAVHLITKDECKLETAEGTLQSTDTTKLALWEVGDIFNFFILFC